MNLKCVSIQFNVFDFIHIEKSVLFQIGDYLSCFSYHPIFQDSIIKLRNGISKCMCLRGTWNGFGHACICFACIWELCAGDSLHLPALIVIIYVFFRLGALTYGQLGTPVFVWKKSNEVFKGRVGRSQDQFFKGYSCMNSSLLHMLR